ncbi:NUDIX hydrolase [Actinosynnema mirum]|uniref:NUDIX hydrolase n=1 Tax=Actinosynnema mirum (strain ATCC 29888 / DSM 43827 / JCM 3225 / NBRC 14064 / NCIMB 13271 / NRRL B-12336 / IMRU 3971 / 101) TaxID=446462 RepID=C6W9Q4_ACTMD|nr:NUDIX domain-containing protein [Actinosynnema mirum]ACU37271.1 NUDIX hydrolase [Actinosynnema mirum DSM 43827]
MKPTVRKVVAFVVHGGRLAVFRQDDEDSGLQVPAGTLRPGERPEHGALREAAEETGLPNLRVVTHLGRYHHDLSPLREEVQDRSVFLLALDGHPPERWDSAETHDGLLPPTPLHFYWVPLDDPELDELVAGQGTLLDKIPR